MAVITKQNNYKNLTKLSTSLSTDAITILKIFHKTLIITFFLHFLSTFYLQLCSYDTSVEKKKGLHIHYN